MKEVAAHDYSFTVCLCLYVVHLLQICWDYSESIKAVQIQEYEHICRDLSSGREGRTVNIFVTEAELQTSCQEAVTPVTGGAGWFKSLWPKHLTLYSAACEAEKNT